MNQVFNGGDVWMHGISPFLEPMELNNMLRAHGSLLVVYIEKIMRECSPDQKQVIRIALMCPHHLLVLGGPGVGKSYVLKIIKKLLDFLFISVEIVAPTGTAAKNCNGKTLQMCFPQLNDLDDLWDDEKKRVLACQKESNNKQEFL